MPRKETSLIRAERIERSILLVRGYKVILDSDLAALYAEPTKQAEDSNFEYWLDRGVCVESAD